MKYVAVAGGLGNQMFQYAYFLMLQELYNNVSLFIPSDGWEHQSGFELSRVFGIKHRHGLWESLYHHSRMFRKLFSITHKTYFGKNFTVADTDLKPDDKYSYFFGTWQSEKYFLNPERIRNSLKFNEQLLNLKSNEIAKTLGGKLQF